MNEQSKFEKTPGDFRAAVWTDKAGIVHAARGDGVHPGIFLMWTACRQHDIPANTAFFKEPSDTVSCPACSKAQREGEG